MSRLPIDLSVSDECIERSIQRAVIQESKYGHNTGHFTLKVEKENTTIGVIGEEVIREFLETEFVNRNISGQISLTEFGSEFDLKITISIGTMETVRFAHIKTGLWQKWPEPTFAFGIHADQNIQNSQTPLILVSLLKNPDGWPSRARVEGFLSSTDLTGLSMISKGDRFPVTGVVSRTDNLVSYIHQYRPMAHFLNFLDPSDK
jgi:hypothetical protein